MSTVVKQQVKVLGPLVEFPIEYNIKTCLTTLAKRFSYNYQLPNYQKCSSPQKNFFGKGARSLYFNVLLPKLNICIRGKVDNYPLSQKRPWKNAFYFQKFITNFDVLGRLNLVANSFQRSSI